MEREGAQGIVLDLRGNGGGLLEEAVLSASLFLPKGEVVVSTELAQPRATPSTRPSAATCRGRRSSS